jgi:glucosamine kinase
MLLIADSGSTKTDWALSENEIPRILHTVGYNPYFMDTETIYHSLSENLLPYLVPEEISQIYFYGAGCSTPENKEIVLRAIRQAFGNGTKVFVGHDLLGAARALLGNQDGFVAILGTGSNTCIYRHHESVMNIDSLGYLLGDEGSGSYIGKKFLRDFMRGQLEPQLHNRFKERFRIENNEQIFETLYSTPFPNRYLSGFCKFAEDFADHPYVRNKVRDSFHDFFKNLVSKYPDYKDYTFNCNGSIGFIYRDILEGVATDYGMKMGKVIRAPIEELVRYHLQN